MRWGYDDGLRQLSGSGAIDGEGSGSFDHDGQANGNSKDVVFVAFALLIAIPVSKESDVPVDEDDGDHHVRADAKSGYAAEESNQQTDAAEEFSGHGQNGEHGGNVDLLREEAERGLEAKTPQPAHDPFRARREEHNTNREAKNGHHQIFGRVQTVFEHRRLPL